MKRWTRRYDALVVAATGRSERTFGLDSGESEDRDTLSSDPDGQLQLPHTLLEMRQTCFGLSQDARVVASSSEVLDGDLVVGVALDDPLPKVGH